MSAPIRVLVVDDSAFVRKVLREVLSSSSDIEVVGIARDGLEALEKIAVLKPDVITLDLVMPQLDGLGVLGNLPLGYPPRVVLVSISDGDSELTVRALQLGAVDVVQKPTALATDQLYALRDELIAKVKAAARARVSVPSAQLSVVARPALLPNPLRKVVVIGTSTGGPQALTRLLPALPAGFSVPIVIALHIPAGYTASLAHRLDELSDLDVQEAEDGLVLRPGLAILARGGFHLGLERAGGDVCVRLQSNLRGLLHMPSVDVLFEHAVRQYGAGVMGVVLTGMGDDGRLGSRAIREAGGLVLTEAETSCVVYGMPRCVVESGDSAAEVPLDRMANEMCARL